MGRLLFFMFGLPIMIVTMVCSSFVDVLNYDFSLNATYNGNEVILQEEQQEELKNILIETFSKSRDVPTIFVTNNEIANEQMQNGYFLRLKFKEKVNFNEYIFDELAFEVNADYSHVCMLRGNDGNFEGRCLYFVLDNNMSNVYNYLNNLNDNKETGASPEIQEPVQEEGQEDNAEIKETDSRVIMRTQII